MITKDNVIARRGRMLMDDEGVCDLIKTQYVVVWY
jgi:hypothetical protein